jgi:hypothetical protein
MTPIPMFVDSVAGTAFVPIRRLIELRLVAHGIVPVAVAGSDSMVEKVFWGAGWQKGVGLHPGLVFAVLADLW